MPCCGCNIGTLFVCPDCGQIMCPNCFTIHSALKGNVGLSLLADLMHYAQVNGILRVAPEDVTEES